MSAERFDKFMTLHKELLDCYSNTNVIEYKYDFNGPQQREFCLT